MRLPGGGSVRTYNVTLIPRSRLLGASVGLAILVFGVPGRSQGQAIASPSVAAMTEARPPVAPPERVAPATRAAEPSEPPQPPRVSRWQRTRIEGAVGVRFGSFTLNGDSSGAAIPFHLDLGLRRDRFLVYAGYDVMSVATHGPAFTTGGTATMTTSTGQPLGDGSGLAQRIGANARYVIGKVGESDGGFEIWGEGGIGAQHIAWDAGGTWTRPDVALGIGGTMVWLGDHKHGGVTIGLRVLLAPRNDTANRAPTCGGPCDTATPPSSLDRSFMFEISVPFGT